jgi:hypothetical protein
MTFTPPASLGPFTFPAPYGTRGIRLTNQGNASAGCDPRLYSYWSCVNNHRGYGHLFVVVGRRGGQAPILLRVEKASGSVTTVRELPMIGTGEGCYFSDTYPTRFYFLEHASLRHVDVDSGHIATVFTFDTKLYHLWQAHSSANDRVHSATVKDDSDLDIGCVVCRDGVQTFIPAAGLDECQIDKSGRYLVIQEHNDNRFIDVGSKLTRFVTNAEGAVAHCDVGEAFVVGEDDQHEPGALVKWDLAAWRGRELLWQAPGWGPGMGHVAVRDDLALLSSNWSGELLSISISGRYAPRPVAPGMISGGDYDHQLRACLDPTGEYACWIAFIAGRFDAFLVKVGQPSPIIVPTQPGGPTVPGSQPYPDENTWWTAMLEEMEALYLQAHQVWDLGAFKWATRIAFDIGAGMDKQQSKVKHLRELRSALGLDGGTTQNP